MGSGGPPFDDLRDNQLNELQSDPSQSILAKVTCPAVQDSDLDSISGSESCLSIDSVHVSNNNEVNKGSLSKESTLLSGNNESDLNSDINKSAVNSGINQSELISSINKSDLHSGMEVQDVSDSVAPKTNVQNVSDSVAPKTNLRELHNVCVQNVSDSVGPKTNVKLQNVRDSVQNVRDFVAPKTNVQNASDSVAPNTNVELQNVRDSVQNASDSAAPKTNAEVQNVCDSVAPKTAGRDESDSVNPKTELCKMFYPKQAKVTLNLNQKTWLVVMRLWGTILVRLRNSAWAPAQRTRVLTLRRRGHVRGRFCSGNLGAVRHRPQSLLSRSLVLDANMCRIWKAPKPGLLHSSFFPFSRYCFV